MEKAKANGKALVKRKARAAEPDVTPNLRVRRAVMLKLARVIDGREWTQAEAAKRCGLTQPRINDLVRGRISRFSLDALVNIAAKLGGKVTVLLEERR